MKQLKLILLLTFLLGTLPFCKSETEGQYSQKNALSTSAIPEIKTGADQPLHYLPLLKGKKVGLVVNQTSIINQKKSKHLVDFLLAEDIPVKKIFVPEHGFRGDADAGEAIENGMDKSTGLPVISLYGSHKKPTPEDLKDLDLLIFDLQDVGVRFYTYISTLHYVMEACAENNKPLIILDRPNPNGDYVDGPVLKNGFKSFVGMHPIPVVHGLTIGELARMINGEKWLKNGVKADISIIPVKNWDHAMPYSLPIKPSPNLPNELAIRLYPSLCFFEGTQISVGRGTTFPFQVIGAPDSRYGDFTFTPKSIPGMSKNPPYEGKKCYGLDLRGSELSHRFTLRYLLDMYKKSGKDPDFFNNFFNTLAGTDELKKAILAGKSEEEIKATWQKDLNHYKKKRSKYLLYK
ncbi:exo-beta-N-acetylmuramidase NamZ domain-containing protein [Echinicola jeungdonensis]|uniref:Exo-beta-N-acetylmuramidase NamZ domain-containing protein n=1 Tax=Echinicola jeungdonensis TaxID=709343 RepID=A0ABV5J8X5_9BACT